ncbi:MAG: ABC transporter ATP-binding protein [Acidimicrobiia bacterium]
MTLPRPDLVALTNVTQRFSNHVTALHQVTITIGAGEIVAVTGTSGSGKSTMLHILGLLARPTEGEYTLAGVKTRDLPDSRLTALRAQRIGFVFQSFHLIPHLTVLENVMISLQYHGTPQSRHRAAAADALGAVGMSHRLAAFPGTLSGGEQQRVAIARAVVRRPLLLLCDEPTGNLDSNNTEVVLNILTQADHTDRAVVIVTHDPDVAKRADRVFSLRDGQIINPMRTSK